MEARNKDKATPLDSSHNKQVFECMSRFHSVYRLCLSTSYLRSGLSFEAGDPTIVSCNLKAVIAGPGHFTTLKRILREHTDIRGEANLPL